MCHFIQFLAQNSEMPKLLIRHHWQRCRLVDSHIFMKYGVLGEKAGKMRMNSYVLSQKLLSNRYKNNIAQQISRSVTM